MPFDDPGGKYSPRESPQKLRFYFFHLTQAEIDQKVTFQSIVSVADFFGRFLFGRKVLSRPSPEFSVLGRTFRDGVYQDGLYFDGNSDFTAASVAFQDAAATYQASTGKDLTHHAVLQGGFCVIVGDYVPTRKFG